MKYFFALIFALFFAGAAYGSDDSFYQSPEFQKRAQEFVAFMERIQQENKQAQRANKTGAISENPDEYNFLSPFYLMQTDTSPLSGTRGYGDFTELPFGKMRLISCYSGIKGRAGVFAAVQVFSKRDWYFYKPDVLITSPTARPPIVGAPLNPPAGEEKSRPYYYNAMYFPFILEVEQTNKPYVLTANVKIKACTINACEIFEAPLSLELTDTERFPTGICPLMMQVLQQTPLPPVDGTNVKAVQNEKGEIQFYFEFADFPKVVSIHIDNDLTYKILSKNIKGHLASIIIKPDTPVQAGDTLPLKVITTQRSYDLPVQVTKAAFVPLSFPFAWTAAFFGGFLLFFFTPFFALFMSYAPRSKKAVRQTGRDMVAAILSVSFLTALAYQAGLIIPYPLIQTYPLLAVLAGLILIFLLVRPKTSVLGAFLGLLVLPKPYLDDVFNTMGPGSVYPFFTIMFWGTCLSLPFYLMSKNPEIFFKVFKVFKSTPVQTTRFMRIPIALLLTWLVIGSIGNAYVNRDIALYTPERLEAALEEGKIVFVSVENPVCLECVWNKAVAFKTGFARPLYKEGKIVLLRAEDSSEQARDLKVRHDKNALPVNVLFGPGNKGGLLLPDYVSYTELKKYLLGVLKPRS